MEILDWFYFYQVVAEKYLSLHGEFKEFKHIRRIRQEYFAVRRILTKTKIF